VLAGDFHARAGALNHNEIFRGATRTFKINSAPTNSFDRSYRLTDKATRSHYVPYFYVIYRFDYNPDTKASTAKLR